MSTVCPAKICCTNCSVASGYSNSQGAHRTPSIAQQLSSPNELRHPQPFPVYQSYPNVSSSMNPSMAPPISGNINPYGRPASNTIMASGQKRARDEEDSELFGDLPEGKKRKFILVDDEQKSTRVRVKVTLDQVNVQDIPDSYRRQNSVYPRSYYPIQMQSEPPTGRFSTSHNDADEAAPTIGNMTVPVTTSDGETQIEVSQLTGGKKDRERKINELGYRMAWGQGRVFSNRPIFLARARKYQYLWRITLSNILSVDAYRTKQRTALVGTSSESTAIPPHLEVRPGKRRWLERTRPGTLRTHSNSPPPKTQEEQWRDWYYMSSFRNTLPLNWMTKILHSTGFPDNTFYFFKYLHISAGVFPHYDWGIWDTWNDGWLDDTRLGMVREYRVQAVINMQYCSIKGVGFKLGHVYKASE